MLRIRRWFRSLSGLLWPCAGRGCRAELKDAQGSELPSLLSVPRSDHGLSFRVCRFTPQQKFKWQLSKHSSAFPDSGGQGGHFQVGDGSNGTESSPSVWLWRFCMFMYSVLILTTQPLKLRSLGVYIPKMRWGRGKMGARNWEKGGRGQGEWGGERKRGGRREKPTSWVILDI